MLAQSRPGLRGDCAALFLLFRRAPQNRIPRHEMVCAGMPLITSDKVGATEKFLVNDQNGFIFNANSGQDLKNNLQKISEKTENEIVAMSKFSYDMSFRVTPSTWRAALLEIL